MHTRKLENCPRLKIEVPPTAFQILTLTFDHGLQSRKSYGHDPYTCKRSRSKVNRFKSESGNRRTDGQTDGRDCIICRANVLCYVWYMFKMSNINKLSNIEVI